MDYADAPDIEQPSEMSAFWSACAVILLSDRKGHVAQPMLGPAPAPAPAPQLHRSDELAAKVREMFCSTETESSFDPLTVSDEAFFGYQPTAFSFVMTLPPCFQDASDAGG